LKRALLLGAVTAALAAFAGSQAATAAFIPPPPPPTKAEHNPFTTEDGIFLCYSKFQVVPGVWSPDVAAQLLADGYWYPDALPGNIDGGTNVGSFNLQCNAAGTPTGMFVNLNGEVVGPDVAAQNLGYYPEFG
jgi:hypothetical protein